MNHPEVVDRLAILNAAHPRKLSQGLHHPSQLRKSWYFFFFDLPEVPESVVHANHWHFFRHFLHDAHPAYTPEVTRDLPRMSSRASSRGVSGRMPSVFRSLSCTGIRTGWCPPPMARGSRRTARRPNSGLLPALATSPCSTQPRLLWSGCAPKCPVDASRTADAGGTVDAGRTVPVDDRHLSLRPAPSAVPRRADTTSLGHRSP
jgi:hypothetical protein